MDTSGAEPAAPEPGSAIGVFGGTFDPVHCGHLRSALDAWEFARLAQVRLIPLGQAVHRAQPQTPAAQRLAMLNAAVTAGGPLVVDDRELRRPGPSYTVDTLRSLHQAFPGNPLCLLLGTDAFAGFATWRSPEIVLRLANLLVMGRPGKWDCADLAARFGARPVEHLDHTTNGQICHCAVTQMDLASSDIRARCAAGRRIDFLTPAPVVDLIARLGLYRSNCD